MLQTIWFILWGVLWAVYFMLDGFDLGVGSLSPFVARDEKERQIVHGSIWPYWDGNEVWLISAGGITFAAFPTTYAVMFSSLYAALMLILFSLIIRGVSVEFRTKTESENLKKWCDRGIFVGSFLPALLFGVAFANIFQGVPIDGQGIFHGTLLTLLNPYGLAGGVLFVLMFTLHGSLWLTVKTEGDLQRRASVTASKLWSSLLIVAVIFLVYTAFATDLYVNYLNNPVLIVIPLTAVAALIGTRVFISREVWWGAWGSSAITIAFVTFFGIAGLFPNLYPSSLDPSYNLTAFNSSSSPLTLKIMLGVAGVMVPVVIAYQVWAYIFFREKVKEGEVGY
jgi:cytochrome d ubiquinol oxidase subunit II